MSEKAQRVAEIFKSALECTREEQATFLDEACAGDAEIRAEVDSLLHSQDGASQFLEQGALQVAAETMARGSGLPLPQIDDYQILSRIGIGGMGEVYLAQDTKLRRKVALKLVRAGMDTAEIVARFRQEERILASLNHSNIAQLYGAGVAAGDVPFLAMEYVEGARIDEYCNAQALSTAARLELFRKVCAAVQYAHQHLIIHRDLKPSNILVAADGEPKLLDFGIAKLIEGQDPFTMVQTLAGVMTPDYASPEQVRGEAMTTSSDVYSLGVLLYEILTGQRPYRLKSRTQDEIARAITEQEPERPSTAVTRIEPNSPQSAIRNPKSLRGDLDNIVLMAMRKEPARRYSSVGQFSEDIRRHLEGLPVIARKDTLGYRSSKFIKRHRVGVAAALLIMLSLLGGVVATVRQTRTAKREKTKAEAISVFLQGMLFASSPDANLRKRGLNLTVKDVLDEASARLATENLSGQAELKAELQRIIGTSYLSLGQYDLAEQNLAAALEAQRRTYGEDSPETLQTFTTIALLWGGAKGDYARADKFYRQNFSLLRAEQAKGRVTADFLANAMHGFALLRRAQGDSKEAERLVREELALAPQLSPQAKNDLSIVEGILALTLADQGKFDEAIRMVRKKIAAIRQQTNDDTPALCANLTGLGSFLIENGELVEAAEHLRQAEAIYRKLYNASNMQLGDNLRLQAQALSALRQYAEAEAKINTTLEIYRAASSPQYVNYPTALIVQGLIFSQTGRTADAEKLLREAVQIRAENVPETHFLRATANGVLGEFLTTQKRFAEAEALLLASYESLKKSQAENSPRMRLTLQRLANLYEAWNKPDQAAPYRALLADSTS